MSILKKGTFVALLLTPPATIFNCELNSEDGRWDPMRWTSNHPGDPRKVTATAEDGVYQPKYTSYEGLWISSVTDTDAVIHVGNKEQDPRHIRHDWYDVLAKENTFYIILLPDTTGRKHKLSINVTAGDIFNHIEVTQNK